MVVKLSSLRVSAELDVSLYKRGASEKAFADEQMIKSSDAFGVALSKADQNLARAIPGMGRLSRSFIDGYTEGEKFERSLRQIGNAMDRGMDADRAVAMLINLEQGFKRVANAAELAKAGMGNVAGVAGTAHIDQSALNSALGVNTGGAGRAASSAAVFEQAATEQQRMVRAAEILKEQINPLAAATARLASEQAQYNAMARAGLLTTNELGAAHAAATQRFNYTADAAKKLGGNVKLSNFELVNLHYQMNDIAVSLASGQSPFTVMMQQGAQIAQIFDANGMKVKDALKGMGTGIVTFLSNPMNQAVLGVALLAAGVAYLYQNWKSSAPSVDDMLKKQKLLIDDLTKAYGSMSLKVADLKHDGLNVINFEARINIEQSKKSILQDLETLQRQVSPGFLATRGITGARSIAAIGEVAGVNGGYTQPQNLPFQKAVQDLRKGIQDGAPDLDKFRAAISDIANSPGATKTTKDLAASALEASGPVSDLARQMEQLKQSIDPAFTSLQYHMAAIAPLLGQAPGEKQLYSFIPDMRSQRSQLDATLQSLIKNATSLKEIEKYTDLASKATKGFNAELEKQRKLGDLDSKSAYARNPLEKANVARDQVLYGALNSSADPAMTALKAQQAYNAAFAQATEAIKQHRDLRRQTANDNISAAQNELSLIGKSNAQRDLMTSNLKAQKELEKDVITFGVAYATGEYNNLVKLNEQHAKLVEKLAVETALYNNSRKRSLSNMNPLDASIESAMDATGITQGTPGYSKVKQSMQDAAADLRTFRSGAKSAFYEIYNSMTDYGAKTKDFFTGLSQAGESMWVNFAKTGQLNLDDLTSFVLESLAKLSYQFASSGLMSLFKGGDSGGSGSGGFLSDILKSLFNASGNAFSGGQVAQFANGGAFTNSIVNKPTMFAYGGKFGVMGEAGPEAIMPLARGRDGKLGVASSGGGQSPLSVNHSVSVTYYGQQQPEVTSNVDSMGRLHIIMREIARQEAAKSIADTMPNSYGVPVKRIARG